MDQLVEGLLRSLTVVDAAGLFTVLGLAICGLLGEGGIGEGDGDGD